MAGRIRVYLESGAKKIFASALDWPGWSRGAKSESEALEALVGYGARYARVVVSSGLDFRAPDDPSGLEVVERIAGGAGTDFGVPSLPASDDDRPLDDSEAERLAAVLKACWVAFERAARDAEGRQLRKGPRGGGRELPRIVEHVLQAEAAYVSQLGGRCRSSEDEEPAEAASRVRARALEVLAARAAGQEPAEPSGVRTRWSPRYFARRSAWHTLDHAWEIEDRVEPAD